MPPMFQGARSPFLIRRTGPDMIAIARCAKRETMGGRRPRAAARHRPFRIGLGLAFAISARQAHEQEKDATGIRRRIFFPKTLLFLRARVMTLHFKTPYHVTSAAKGNFVYAE